MGNDGIKETEDFRKTGRKNKGFRGGKKELTLRRLLEYNYIPTVSAVGPFCQLLPPYNIKADVEYIILKGVS